MIKHNLLKPKAIRKVMTEYAWHMMAWDYYRNSAQFFKNENRYGYPQPLPYIYEMVLTTCRNIYREPT